MGLIVNQTHKLCQIFSNVDTYVPGEGHGNAYAFMRFHNFADALLSSLKNLNREGAKDYINISAKDYIKVVYNLLCKF